MTNTLRSRFSLGNGSSVLSHLLWCMLYSYRHCLKMAFLAKTCSDLLQLTMLTIKYCRVWFCGFGIVRKVAQKATISFVMSVSPRGTRLPPDEFSWNLIYEFFFLKPVEKIPVSLKSDKNKGYFTCRPIYIFIISHSVLLRMRNVSHKFVGRKNQNTLFMYNIYNI